MKSKIRPCKYCGTDFTQRYSTLERFCSPLCASKSNQGKPKKKRKRIPYRSPKRKMQEEMYSKLRKKWLEDPRNKFCFIEGCNKLATTVEHTKGRAGDMLLELKVLETMLLGT